MSRFHQLLIDVANLDFIDADSAELALVRTSSADSFSKVPVQRHQIESLPGSVKILPNDPGSAYELRLFKGKKSVASGFFVMPGYDHALVAQDLRTAWPIQFDQSFDLESRLSDKADTLALESEIQSRELSDSDLQEQIDTKAAQADLEELSDLVDTKASQNDLNTLAGNVADVQNLAEVNQLNIAEKADQDDLDSLQTTVVGQGITLAQKANQTALDALATVVNGKATPADISAAIAALVDGAPAALDTLAELATALAGEQAQISTIYDAGGGNAGLQNATYENGVLHYTGGTVPTSIGDLNGCSLTVPADTQITLGYQPDTLTAGQSLVYLWHTSADAATALTVFLSNGHGLSIIAQSNGFYVRVDWVSSGSLADPGPSVVNLTGRRLQIDVPGVPNASYETPETASPAPTYLHIFSLNTSGGSAVADAAFDLSPAPGVATGLLPDETAARIAGDAALQDQIDDVQNLAEVNQLNIAEKADQTDLEVLQTTVTSQGLTLLQKADQTALTALGTVVSGKATPADISAAIAALVDGAPDALNTLAELATALAGEQAQIADLLTALALRVRVDAVQSLTLAQQLQARQNINAEAAGVAAGLVAAITPASIGAATAVQGGKADTALQSADVAPVALSGQYSDLAGLPTIPGLSSSTPAAPTTNGTAGTATVAARGDHAHPLPTAAQITAAVLTGLATGSATAIAAADTILQALEKLQAQASVNAELLAPVPRKIGPSWYQSGGWYDVEYPKQVDVSAGAVTLGVVTFIPRQILEAVTFTSLAFYCSIGFVGATGYAGIYSDNNGEPGTLLASISADCSTSGTKTGAVSLTLTAGQIVWDAFLNTGATAQLYRQIFTRALPQQGLGAAANSFTCRYLSGQSSLPTNPTATAFGQAAQIVRTLLQAQ